MTVILYPGQHRLAGAERGYRQPGKRLLPRDAHDAYELRSMKLHSLHELKLACIAERKAYGELPTPEHFDPFDRPARLTKALSSRRRKLVEAALPLNVRPPLPRSLRRLVEAWDQAERIACCMDADARMLANAY